MFLGSWTDFKATHGRWGLTGGVYFRCFPLLCLIFPFWQYSELLVLLEQQGGHLLRNLVIDQGFLLLLLQGLFDFFS